MSAAKVLADDGKYTLRYRQSSKLYVAGCYRFTRENAIRHWTERSNERCFAPGCNCRSGINKRARLFLTAIKAHAAEQSK